MRASRNFSMPPLSRAPSISTASSTRWPPSSAASSFRRGTSWATAGQVCLTRPRVVGTIIMLLPIISFLRFSVERRLVCAPLLSAPRAEHPGPETNLRVFGTKKNAPREETVSTTATPLGTILVADDNQSARDMLEMMLRSHGYCVFAVVDGAQALELLRQEPIDLALIDVVMPGQNGFAVCRAAKDLPATRLTPIVLITGLGRVQDRIQGIEAGADDFLNKPVRKEELLARVKSLVRIKRFTDELESAETVVFTLAASIEAKDPYTEGHCERLSRYSVVLGERLGLSEE